MEKLSPDLFAVAERDPEPHEADHVAPELEYPDLEAAELDRFHDALANTINDAWEAGLHLGVILDALEATRRHLQASMFYAERDDDISGLPHLIERDDIGCVPDGGRRP